MKTTEIVSYSLKPETRRAITDAARARELSDSRFVDKGMRLIARAGLERLEALERLAAETTAHATFAPNTAAAGTGLSK